MNSPASWQPNPCLRHEAFRREINEGLQASLVYVNTRMLQSVLIEPKWSERLTPDDSRGLTPLIYGHVCGVNHNNERQRLCISTCIRNT